ncbi:MAG: TorF family putative porin [Halieaceae bacterium]|jgi:uncharacterized protein (TIGR02001 family)|nr:TorF family putative porin [Halieaceae bacterium]
MQFKKSLTAAAVVAAGLTAAPTYADSLSANASVTNNYIWRGLTQTTNEPAVQGGIDYGHDSGFYVGTWVSNVQYASDDVYSYEHDMYAGFAFDVGEISFDIGYLYYNYDEEAEFDFGEVYGTIAWKGLSASAYVLTNTEADEVGDQDFGAGEAYYISIDYAFEVGNGIEIGLHGGYHDGDFMEAFNGADGDYYDYNISLSKGGFGFMISDTDVGGPASEGGLDNDEMKFVISYSVDVDLL